MTRTPFLLAVTAVLVGTSPALAQQNVSGCEVVGGLACCIGILGIFVGIPLLFFRGFLTELSRGRKQGMTDEEIIDELPKKRQVMFKGEKVPDWRIAARSKATRAILKFLSCTDNWFDRKYQCDVADEAVRLVKEAIEAQSVRGLERRVTPDLLEELRGEVKKLRDEREVHVFGRVQITDVNVVHVEAPVGKENHTFTVLVSMKSKDYFEDEETGEPVRGDDKTYSTQEFWTFRRSEKRWLVELIRPSADLDSVLEAKNVMAEIDLEEFAKDAEPEFLNEVVAR